MHEFIAVCARVMDFGIIEVYLFFKLKDLVKSSMGLQNQPLGQFKIKKLQG